MSYTYEALSPGGHQEMLEEVFSKVREQVGSYKTASGSLVSFNDGADLPMPSFICNIDAVQDLHGYDAPWVGSARKNKLPITSNSETINGVTFTVNKDSAGNVVSVTANGTATATVMYNLGMYILEANTYIMNGCPTGGSPTTFYMDWRKDDGSQLIDKGKGSTYTSNGQTDKYARIIIANGTTCNNLVFYPMIRLATETDPTFAPYSNICPISGHIGVDAWVRGKNLLPQITSTEKSGLSFTQNNDGSVRASGTPSANDVQVVVSEFELPAGSYIVSTGLQSVPSTGQIQIRVGKGTGGTTLIGQADKNNDVNFTLTEPTTIRISYRIQNLSGTQIDVTYWAMLRLSSESITYEPYNPNSQTIQVNWQTEAGEVFGGYVDLVSGVLTATHKSQTGFTRGSQDSTHKLYSIGFPAGMKRHLDGTISPYFIDNMFEKMSLANARASEIPSITQYNNVLYVGGYIGKAAELDTLLETLQVVYELATPITYQLTSTQIKSLLGNNNAWCSTGAIKFLQYQPNNIIAELRSEILALQARVKELEEQTE